jgi:outer membrane protein assembly factor BamA
VDTRDQPGNPRAGGFYDIGYSRYRDLDARRPGFRRVDFEAQHFFPIFDKKRVIAARVRGISTAAPDGQDVPFYFQPTLGGSDSLRSYADYRLRDRNVLFMNVEYRWEAFSGLDMALFSDWGKVAPGGEDLNLSSLKHAYGLGFRFNTYKTVFLRFDIAAGGGEGVRYFLKYSNAF